MSPESDAPSDAQLVARIGTGDEAAWEALFARYGKSLYRFGLRSTGSPDAADEIVQEVFLALIRRPEHFDPQRGALSSYLFGAARNQIARRMRSGPVLAEPEEGVSNQTPLDELSETERLDAVRRGVQALPQNYREVIILCDLEEMSYEQAGAALAIPVGTVRSRLSRGRGLLERKLAIEPALQEGRR